MMSAKDFGCVVMQHSPFLASQLMKHSPDALLSISPDLVNVAVCATMSNSITIHGLLHFRRYGAFFDIFEARRVFVQYHTQM